MSTKNRFELQHILYNDRTFISCKMNDSFQCPNLRAIFQRNFEKEKKNILLIYCCKKQCNLFSCCIADLHCHRGYCCHFRNKSVGIHPGLIRIIDRGVPYGRSACVVKHDVLSSGQNDHNNKQTCYINPLKYSSTPV